MVRGDRGRVPVIPGTGSGTGTETSGTGTGTGTEAEDEGRRTRLASSLPTLTGHVTGLPTTPAQAREGAGSGQMVRFFTNATSNRLAGIPRTTNKTKKIEGRRDRGGHGHQQETVTITQVRKIFKTRMTNGVDITINGQSRLDGLIGQFSR